MKEALTKEFRMRCGKQAVQRGAALYALAALMMAGVPIAATGAAAAQEGSLQQEIFLEECGYTYPVDGYRADIGGLDISLPANDRLVVNGEVLAERAPFGRDTPPEPWVHSANTARVGFAGQYLIVRTLWTDCVDYASSHIYMLDRSTGALWASGALPAVHHRYSLRLERDSLVFANEWYCSPDGGAPAGSAFVYVLRNGAGAFEREERSWMAACGDAIWVQGQIYFAPMQPVVPQRAPEPGREADGE
ncbi:MAG: hypothetical protein KIS81_07440 [Maricaulaceae bacterium]|nr:hypothetical protein [Maricaulaceae bacterium]